MTRYYLTVLNILVINYEPQFNNASIPPCTLRQALPKLAATVHKMWILTPISKFSFKYGIKLKHNLKAQKFYYLV